MPPYISFEPILIDVEAVLKGRNYREMMGSGTKPNECAGVNYNLITNKDGRFAWRPLELIHPAIYVSLVNTICSEENWSIVTRRFSEFNSRAIECCSAPVMSLDDQTDAAAQVRSWWQSVEQRALVHSLEFSHVLHTDVVDCYGSLYTHSISWALHGLENAKDQRRKKGLLGNKIDSDIQAGRYGQTNGISQGSALMDFIAEIVLGYVDEQINEKLKDSRNFHIIRYRDDYRIFANSDDQAEDILKVISENLRNVGMRLGLSKTNLNKNIIEGSVKPGKLAGIDLQDFGKANAKTIQKQLLRMHSFGRRFPNSGALRRLVSEFHVNILEETERPDDLEVQVAIATDIGFVSPTTFPVVAGILSHLISLASAADKPRLWDKVQKKMRRVPHNGYLEIWLQRVIQPEAIGMKFDSDESICQVVNGKTPDIWENKWIASVGLKNALEVSKIIVGSAADTPEVVQPKEVELFKRNAWAY